MSVKDDIYRGIQKAIISENLSPGERLVEVQLCKEFGASRGPVREALTQLNREGFVELIPNKGAVVTKLSIQDLRDYYALAALLESKAVEWAIPHLNSSSVAVLRTINKDLAKIAAGDEEDCLPAWTRHNLRFHRFFWEKSGNFRLVEQIQEIRQRILRYRYTSLMVPSFSDYLSDHDTIIAAVKEKDAHKAGRAMHRHILRALDVLLKHFARMPGRINGG